MDQEKELTNFARQPQQQGPIAEPPQAMHALPNDTQTSNPEPSESNARETAAAEQKEEHIQPADLIAAHIERLNQYLNKKEFKEFWFYGPEVKRELFQIRNLTKDERTKALKQLDELFERAKLLEEQNNNLLAMASALKLQRIQEMLNKALDVNSVESIQANLTELDKVSAFIREGVVELPIGISLPDMLPADRDQARDMVRKAREELLNRLQQIREQNFQLLSNRLNELTNSLDKEQKPYFKIVKGLQSIRSEMFSMSLNRWHRKEIDQALDVLYKKARDSQSAQRTDELRKRIQGMEHLIVKKQHFISALDKEIKDLEMRWSGVKNDFFRSHIQERLAEKKAKTEQAQKDIASIREKINFLAEQLKLIKD